MSTVTTLGTYKVVQLPKRYLAYVRHTGPYMGNPALFERLFNRVMTWMAPKGLLQRPNLESISVYHDDPENVPVEKQRISVGFTVPEGTKGEGDVQIMEIPAGRYAIGSFELLPDQYGEAWGECMQYIQEANLIPAEGPMYESYKNDPRQHPEGKHVVDICIAVK